MEGTMLWFNPTKRHGFIWTDDGERLQVDREGFADGKEPAEKCRGTRVSFERTAGGDPRAVNVAVVPLIVAQRARLRGRR
jgi:cold shock CspA family protein